MIFSRRPSFFQNPDKICSKNRRCATATEVMRSCFFFVKVVSLNISFPIFTCNWISFYDFTKKLFSKRKKNLVDKFGIVV